MPTPITPSASLDIDTSFDGPINGELADDTTVNNPFTTLATNDEALRLLTYGGGLRRRVVCTSSTVMDIYPLGAVVVKVAGVWTCVADVGTTPTTKSPTALAGALAASTRYYVYVSISAGALTWSASTTAPSVGLRYKTGDEAYFYVTTFYTDSSAAVLPYTQDDNVYTYSTYKSIATGTDANLFLDRGAATVITSVSIGGSIPTNASAVVIKAAAEASTNNATSTIGRDLAGGLHNVQAALYPVNGGGLSVFALFSISGASTSVEYLNDVNTTRLSLWVAGFVY